MLQSLHDFSMLQPSDNQKSSHPLYASQHPVASTTDSENVAGMCVILPFSQILDQFSPRVIIPILPKAFDLDSNSSPVICRNQFASYSFIMVMSADTTISTSSFASNKAMAWPGSKIVKVREAKHSLILFIIPFFESGETIAWEYVCFSVDASQENDIAPGWNAVICLPISSPMMNPWALNESGKVLMNFVPIQSDSSRFMYGSASCHTDAMISGFLPSRARLYAIFPAVQPYSRRISGAKRERLKLSRASGSIWLLKVQVVPTIVSKAREPEMSMDIFNL